MVLMVQTRPRSKLYQDQFGNDNNSSFHQSNQLLSPVYCAATVAACTGYIYGYNTTIISGVSFTLVNNTYFTNTHEGSQLSYLQGLLTSTIMIGGMIGSFIGPIMANKYGRRFGLFICGAICTIFCIILGSVNNFIAVCIVRGLVGIGVGISCTVGPLYMAEVSPIELRGSLGVLFEVGIAFGMLISLLINYVMSPGLNGSVDSSLDRTTYGIEFGLGGIGGIALMILPYVLPETNVHNHHNNNKILEQLPGICDQTVRPPSYHQPHTSTDHIIQHNNNNTTDCNIIGANVIQIQLEPIITSIQPHRQAWKYLLTTRQGAYYVFISTLLCATDMWTGINSVFFYSPTIFTNAGLSNVLLYTFIFVGIWNLITCIVPYYCVDRFGRRPLFCISLVGMTISMLLLALDYIVLPSSVSPALSIVFVLLFLAMWQLGTGGLFFLLAAELYPDHIREEAMTLTNMTSWAMNITMSLIFPGLTSTIGIGYTILIQFGVSLVCTALSILYIPETKHQAFAATQLIHNCIPNSVVH